ncbi:MAG: pilin [Patescibacteria group bacterium]
MKVRRYVQLILTFSLLLFAQQASANCIWTLNNQCQDIGATNNWAASQETSCTGMTKPNGDTAKCCCAGNVTGCCEKKDKAGNITTENLIGETCKRIDYASTIFYQDQKAVNNQCISKKLSDNTCGWKVVDAATRQGEQSSGGCSSLENQAAEDQCTLPPESVVRPRYNICCCSKASNIQLTPAAPKFTLPDIQVTIPGLKLTPSSSLVTSVNPDGSTQVSVPWISEYLLALYNYSLSIAGILAALVLMAGGVLWLISGGDASKITQSKELISGSLAGILILFCSYIILYQINPALTIFKPLDIGVIQDLEPESLEGNINNTTVCENCVILDSKIPYKNGKQVNSSLNTKLINTLTNSTGLKWRVTEAYPPSSTHKSKCHYNGACVDVALTAEATCENVNKLLEALKKAGLKTLNEYLGCSGTKTTYSTGGHIHVQ